VVKPFTFEVLVARVHALLRRHEHDHRLLLRFADLTLDEGAHAVRRGRREISLTALEFRLLREFLMHPRQVLPKEVLLDRVWGYDFAGNGNVVEVYVKQLRQKLEGEGEERLIHTIRNAGYVLREE
jgi:DNA-binding response OmpR family regulator